MVRVCRNLDLVVGTGQVEEVWDGRSGGHPFAAHKEALTDRLPPVWYWVWDGGISSSREGKYCVTPTAGIGGRGGRVSGPRIIGGPPSDLPVS